MVDRRGQQKRTICSACELCYAIQVNSSFFAVFDSLVVLTTRSDSESLRSGDFYADDRQNQSLCPLCMCMG